MPITDLQPTANQLYNIFCQSSQDCIPALAIAWYLDVLQCLFVIKAAFFMTLHQFKSSWPRPNLKTGVSRFSIIKVIHMIVCSIQGVLKVCGEYIPIFSWVWPNKLYFQVSTIPRAYTKYQMLLESFVGVEIVEKASTTIIMSSSRELCFTFLSNFWLSAFFWCLLLFIIVVSCFRINRLLLRTSSREFQWLLFLTGGTEGSGGRTCVCVFEIIIWLKNGSLEAHETWRHKMRMTVIQREVYDLAPLTLFFSTWDNTQ